MYHCVCSAGGSRLGDFVKHDHDSPVSILQKGSKGDSLNSLVRVEFGANQLGESPKVEANTETHSTEYNFSASFDCNFEDASSLDSISYKPVTGW